MVNNGERDVIFNNVLRGLTFLDTSGVNKSAKIVHFSIDLLMKKRFTMQYDDF